MKKNCQTSRISKPLASSLKTQNLNNIKGGKQVNQTIAKRIYEKNIAHLKIADYFQKISPHLLKLILLFYIDSYKSYSNLLRVNKYFHTILNDENFQEIWINMLQKQLKKNFHRKQYEILPSGELKKIVMETEKSEIFKRMDFFTLQIQKSFSLLANKMRVPEKLIKSLDLVCSLEIFCNRKSKMVLNKKKINFRNENFGSYLVLSLDEINKIVINQKNDFLEIKIRLESLSLRKSISFSKVFNCELMKSKCIQTKLFNIYGEENSLVYFFEDDSKILKAILNIPAATIITNFDKIIKNDKMIYFNDKKSKIKPTISTPIYENFCYFFKNESDFEFSLNINDNKNTLFNFIDTKLYPSQIEKDLVIFIISCKENIKSKFELLISDNLGISEKIENFVFVNFTLKSQSQFLLINSSYSKLLSVEDFNDFQHGPDYEKQVIVIENDQKTYEVQIDFFHNNFEKTKIVENIKILIKKQYFFNF